MTERADSSRSDLIPGDTLGPYRIEAVAGKGGTGTVFRALRESDGVTVALKVLHDDLYSDETYRRRFAREVRAASEVDHTHLVPVIDVGEVDGDSYIATPFFAAGSLALRLRSERVLPIAEAVRVATCVAAGLDALHQCGLVHRDVKPSNVVLGEDGTPYLTDFGLAKGRDYTILTESSAPSGTPHYLAPELIEGENATPASDLYALGCTVFECFTGAPPYQGRSLLEIGMAHLSQTPPDPCALRPEIPAALGWATLRALEKEPAERPPTALAYATMLNIAARPRPAD